MQAAGEWSVAKSTDPTQNEDVHYIDVNVAILADGATDKTGVEYPSGKTGGKELAEIATSVAAASDKNGYELADEVTAAITNFYTTTNPEALTDASKRAATTLVAARIVGDELIITQIGDTNVRLTMTDDTVQIITNDKLVDTENANTRSKHVADQLAQFESDNGRVPNTEERKAIVASGREAIIDRLRTQYLLENSTEDATYGYATLSGTNIPREFSDGTPTNYVKTFSIPVSQIVTIELASDGFYGKFPDTVDVGATRLSTERSMTKTQTRRLNIYLQSH